MLTFLLPNEQDNTVWGLELCFLEDGAKLELQSGSEHRTTGSQEEQHEQEDDEREDERVDMDFCGSCSTRKTEEKETIIYCVILTINRALLSFSYPIPPPPSLSV